MENTVAKKITVPKKKPAYKVKMVGLNEPTATRTYTQSISKFTRLGKEIKVSPKANISINSAGFKTEFFVETVSVLIGIGKDYTADLVMTLDAWKALKKGEPISIETTESFKKNL
jgi:hypothetical protein